MLKKVFYVIAIVLFIGLININVNASSFKCTYRFGGNVYVEDDDEAKNSPSVLPFYLEFSKEENSKVVKFSIFNDSSYTIDSFLQERHGQITISGVRNARVVTSFTRNYGPSFNAGEGLYESMSNDCYKCPDRLYINLSNVVSNSHGSVLIRESWVVDDLIKYSDFVYLQNNSVVYDDITNTCEYPYNDYNLSFGSVFSNVSSNQGCSNVNNILVFLNKYIFKPIKWIVPICLILLTSFDLAKTVFGKEEEGMKKTKDNFVKRALIALIVFLSPTIITLVLNLVDSVTDNNCVNSNDFESTLS